MEIGKLKKKRTSLKSATTRLLTKIEQSCKTETDKTSFEILLDQLLDKFNMLKQVNSDILELLDIEEIEADIEISEDYQEKLIAWKCKLTNKIKEIKSRDSSNSNLNVNPSQGIVETQNSEVKSVKLPRLTVNKFYGEAASWLEFYSQFENAIDKNPNLSKIEKLIYLRSFVSGPAAATISGFALTESNYDAALELLRSRYGQKNLLINSHLGILLNINPVKDSSDTAGLRKLFDKAEVQIRNLESLGIDSSSYGNLLTPILLKLIPSDLCLEFSRKNKGENWDLKGLLEFLSGEIESRVRATSVYSSQTRKNFHVDSRSENPPVRSKPNVGFSKQVLSAHELMTGVKPRCIFCKSNHDSELCESLTVDQKKDFLKKDGRCFLCLYPKHRIRECRRKERCGFCGKRHSKAICYGLHKKAENDETNSADNSKIISAVSPCQAEIRPTRIKVLLQTASVQIRNKDEFENVRILFDTGSMRSFIAQDISRKLKLPTVRKELLSVYSFGAKHPIEKTFNVVRVKLENREDPTLNLELEVLEIEQISAAHISPPDINFSNKAKYLKGLQLADCYKTNPDDQILVLIGADYYYSAVTGRIKCIDKKLVAIETLFGWCLQGKNGYTSTDSLNLKVIVEENEISEQIKNFWQLENLGIESETQTSNSVDEGILSTFESNIKFENNRYKVKLPWKPEIKHLLYDNRKVAEERFTRLNFKFKNDPILFVKYKNVIEDYIHENIIEPIPIDCEDETGHALFYLPHRAVIREDRLTSKLRVVFDASSHRKGELSLNDCLYIGPNLYPDLFNLLINFRRYPVAFSADIKQAFLNIEIDEEDRDVTRFFWKESPDCNLQPPQIYRFTRVLFGINSSPFLLSATIKHHLKKYLDVFPETFELLNQSCYVDDIIAGHENVEGAFNTSLECIQIFQEAGMSLHKWQTNSKELNELWIEKGISVEKCSETIGQAALTSRVLGMAWNTEDDYFYFDTQYLREFLSNRIDSKRFLLQVAGRIFDPIGFLSPYTIRVKCLIQEVWAAGVDWDEELPPNLSIEWKEWCNELEDLDKLLIPRCYFEISSCGYIKQMDLHCFSDASKKAFATVIYLRVITCDNNIYISFVTSKTRVAPLKTLSLPKLELMGALLSARLCDKVSKTFKCVTSSNFWTDSMIVYYWIKSSPARFKPFVKNRLEEIQKMTQPCNWHHCPGKENPADLPSRGVSAADLKISKLWWFGPPWLCQPTQSWPNTEQPVVNNNELELRSKFKDVTLNKCTVEPKEPLLNLDKFSSLTKVLRVTSWIFRFVGNVKNHVKLKDALSAEELQQAEEFWIRDSQAKFYSSEISALKNGEKIKKDSNIFSLVPFLDSRQILRLTGRLDRAELNLGEKHPILLPQSAKFTELLVIREHNSVLHSGVSATVTQIRRKYWIPKGRQLVKKIIGRCLICKRYSVRPANQLTAQLPKDRIVETPPFNICGIDFAGPVYIKSDQETKKSYIALFVCAVTRAIHIELVSDMSTNSFMLAFRRFISRRGSCSIVYSDNAKTFKCAKQELKYFVDILKDLKFQDFLSTHGITWKFIIERAPWWGGFYERLVKSIKDPLRKILGKALLNFEELTTVLSEIEAVLNMRPLTYVYNDFDEPEPLSPAHFLHFGRKTFDYPLNFLELENKVNSKESLVKRKLYQTKLLKQLWLKWKEQYLLDLKTVHNFKTPEIHSDLKIGDVVLVEGVSKSKFLWDLGIVDELIQGRDGHIRACVVKTVKGRFRKPVQLLYPLELKDPG